ncbi:hypothetical protein RhiirC2_772183 [Rhizophagus irregularis]|uniref:Uncharacterized protein n=1 Tax=Rhizophagus irregularis TaxID=588596 RepID=A0A2N1NS47_9GLOM|nr:hypothetical protein RhiirC2_772183 [Rhizophagus irregularis]
MWRIDRRFEILNRMWVCPKNEKSLKKLIESAIVLFEERLLEESRISGIEIMRILQGKSRIWELLRRVYNRRYNDIIKSKEDVIDDERKKGINKKDKGNKRRTLDSTNNNIEKKNKNSKTEEKIKKFK